MFAIRDVAESRDATFDYAELGSGIRDA